MTYTQILAFRKWFKKVGYKIWADCIRKELNKPNKFWKMIKK